MNIDYKKKVEDIQNWIAQTVENAGFQDVVIALSGGIDSVLSTTLAVQALGKEHVHVLLLPYGKLSKKATEDAKKVTEFLALPKENVNEIDIKKAADTMINDKGSMINIRKGNIMARIRMIYLYDFAKANNCLVVGTENKSEYYLGYFTRFGDEASDIEPIRSLYKTQVKELAKFLNLPEEIITKAPTAGLWEGQTDEKEFGFSYEEADAVLYHYFDERLPEEGMLNLEISREVVEKVLNFVKKNDFKRNLPFVLK